MLKNLNHTYLKRITIAFLLLTLTACSFLAQRGDITSEKPGITIPPPTISPLPLETNQETSPSTSVPQSELEPTPAPFVFQNTRYHFDINFNYGNQSAHVIETITYTLPQSIMQSELLLACDPLRYPDVFLLNTIRINGQNLESYETGKYWIKFSIPETLKNGDEFIIVMDFNLKIPIIPPPADDRKPGIFGYTSLQTNFVDWYPFIPPIDETGNWLLHDPWYYGEYLVYDPADFDVNIQIDNAPPNTMVAASSLPIDTHENQYNYSQKHARNFTFSISPSFLSKQVVVNGVTITSYFFPFHQTAGESVLLESAKALQIYSELFGPYPRSNLTIVEADFLDGMEYDGLYFLSKGFYNLYDGTPKGYLTTIAVHETAHQWWYTLVGNDQALEPWLDEAFCTYSEYLFYENAYPDLKDWWWAYRVDYYKPGGFVNLPVYAYQGFVPYRDATYLRGAQFLHQLRQTIGDPAYFEFTKKYVSLFHDSRSTTLAFWDLLKQTTDADIQDLQTEFFSSE
ncbi:MAG: hypothetical protein CVU39_16965 [Chloroflexi bacterium HGW-Chloroflexi-10]|nr:MAG: hypothetical protein CVU39_16965 [Chloroflexi bacterium HGW-Chloroflexi-10]